MFYLMKFNFFIFIVEFVSDSCNMFDVNPRHVLIVLIVFN